MSLEDLTDLLVRRYLEVLEVLPLFMSMHIKQMTTGWIKDCSSVEYDC